MLAAGALWGLAIAGFGAVGSLWATLLCLAVAGAADVSSVVMRTTIIQTNTPDELRGRVNAAEFVVGASGPQVGNFRGGLVASASTPGISAISGGLSAAVAAAMLAFAFPALRRYRYEPVGTDAQALDATAGSAGLGAVEALVGQQEVLVEGPEATAGLDDGDLEHPEVR